MRIISGIYKSRKLFSPPQNNLTRPTTDRAKETLFNTLGNYFSFENIVCVDLFCGTGNLGLESISRGASLCYFVDKYIKSVERNVRELKVEDKCEIFRGDVFTFLKSGAPEKIDICFADPPYNFKYYEKLIKEVSKMKTVFVLEHSSAKKIEFPEITPFLTKKIGITTFSFFDAD
jgi:16S rRNA (guanine(966)-N(2))-methyltransferase RsmD